MEFGKGCSWRQKMHGLDIRVLKTGLQNTTSLKLSKTTEVLT